jgi:hypothetical protein
MRPDFTPIYGDEDDFLHSILLDRLLNERDRAKSCVSVPMVYKCPHGHKTIAEAMTALNPVHIFQENPDKAIVEFDGKNFLLVRSKYNSSSTEWRVALCGDYDWAMAFKADHGQDEEDREKGKIAWHYWKSRGIEQREFEVNEPLPIYNEFYPCIPEGIDAYFERYLKSRASIMLMIGDPGTGKTSLLRYLIWKNKLRANVTFDEDVMKSEEYFLDYASGTDQDLMVIEDADLLLSSRDSDQNKLMAKLLNLSEGLVSLDGKKMIFTTNLTNMNKIDPALVRPGRCFDVLRFRSLTADEAEKAAKVAGVTLEKKKAMTLAELFNASREKEELERFKLLKTA